jgi:hypothetical protein
MINNVELIRAGLAPMPLPCTHVARVFRPEAFIEPAPRDKKRPKALAAELTTHPKCNSISRHTPHEIFTLTHTKQTIAAPISRHKTDPPIFVNLSSGLTGSTDLLDKRQHARR